jgi:two-component system alkaline phosphatase synthesis response regulator PhoP
MPRILVIDDSAVQRVLARGVLENANFEVLDASNGDAGLSLARGEAIDCILLDWLMPGTSGCDVLRVIQEEGITIPVIVVTGTPDDAVRAECARLGAASVIDKPRDGEVLINAIHSVLRTGSS